MKALAALALLHISAAGREYATKNAGKWPDCSNIQCFDRSTLSEMQASCDGFTECSGFTFRQDATVGDGCLKDCNPVLSEAYDDGPYAFWTPVYRDGGGHSYDPVLVRSDLR